MKEVFKGCDLGVDDKKGKGVFLEDEIGKRGEIWSNEALDVVTDLVDI